MTRRLHLPGCTSASLAELHPNEPKPDHLSDYTWTQVRLCKCVEGCPRLEAAIARGLELERQGLLGVIHGDVERDTRD